jgi:hypothetical protein
MLAGQEDHTVGRIGATPTAPRFGSLWVLGLWVRFAKPVPNRES